MALLKSKSIVVLGIIAFLSISFWALHSMTTDEHGKMVNCPFMSGLSNLCQMNVSEHISQWQQLFTVIQKRNLLLFLSTLLIFLPIVLFIADAKAYGGLKFQRFREHFHRYKPEIKLFDYLVIAFSQGNIHPQIYA